MAFTKLYLSNQAAPYTPATIRGAWNDTAGAVTKGLWATPEYGGVIASVARVENAGAQPYDVLLYRGVGPKLAAQTINCNIDVRIAVVETPFTSCYWHLHVYVTQGDSDTPRGTLITDYRESSNEWPGAGFGGPKGLGLVSAQATASLAVSDGDRIVVELGFVSRDTGLSEGTLYYGTLRQGSLDYFADMAVNDTAVTAKAGIVTFSASIAELVTESRATQAVAEALTGQTTTESRATQVVAEALLGPTTPSRFTQVVVEALITNLQPPDIELPEGGLGLTWVEVRDSANAMHVWAKVALPDPSTYYYGYKEERVIRWGTLSRALSDRTGQPEAVQFTWYQADTDRTDRARLAALSTKYFRNSPVTVRMIDDDNRRLLARPRTVLRGYLSDYRPKPRLGFEFKATDVITSRFAALGQEPAKLPKRLITNTDFTDAPQASLNKGVPIIYSIVADANSDTTSGGGGASGPVLVPLNGVPGGYFPYGLGLQGPEMGGTGAVSHDAAHRSFGVLAGTVPTNPVVTATAGGSLPFSRNNSWSAMVTAVRAGVESDPSPMANASVNFDAGQRSVSVSWTAPSGPAPDTYNVYVSNNPFGVNTAMSTYFTPFHVASDYCWVFSVAGGLTSLAVTAAGANYAFERVFVYRIAAVLSDLSESPSSGEIVAMSHPYRRPVHLRWLPYAGAIGYKIYRRPYTGTTPTDFDTTFTTGALGQTGIQVIDGVNQLEFFDLLDGTGETVTLVAPPPGGVVKPIPVGTETIAGVRWTRLLIAGHACKLVGNVYRNGARVPDAVYGVSLLVPGKTGWPFGATTYRDINGRRYTLIYALNEYAAGHLDNSAPLTVNVEGIESSGVGTGSLITRAFDIYLHALQNWIYGDYQSGGWLSTPVFEDDPELRQIDEASFATCQAISVQRVGGVGYVGAGIIGADGELVTVRDVIARFNQSWDCDQGFDRRCRYFVSMVDESLATRLAAGSLVDVTDIHAESFETWDDLAAHANVIPLYYRRDYSGRNGAGWLVVNDEKIKDQTSITSYTQGGVSGLLRAPKLELHFTRDQTTAEDVGYRQLMRRKDPPRYASFKVGMSGFNIELGQMKKVTHFEGIGAQGYVSELFRISRHEGDPNTYQVTLEAHNLTSLVSTAAIVGDESTLPAAWTSATTAQRAYFYLGDETTGLFSDGTPMMRLR